MYKVQTKFVTVLMCAAQYLCWVEDFSDQQLALSQDIAQHQTALVVLSMTVSSQEQVVTHSI